jgi:alpha-glucosidase
VQLAPHHDGSDLYVDRLGDSVALRVRVAEGAAAGVAVRYVRDDDVRIVAASFDARADGEDWWRVEIPLRSPVLSYRFLLTGGTLGYGWLNSLGLHGREVSSAGDFRLNAEPGGPDWHLGSVVYEIFLDRFASSGDNHPIPGWAVPRDWDAPREARTRHREVFGGDLRGIEERLDYIQRLGASVLWLTSFFPANSNHRYDPLTFEHVDDLLGGDEAFASLARAAHARGMRLVGDFPLDHAGSGHEWFVRAQADQTSAERAFFLFDRSEQYGYATWFDYKEFPRFDWRSTELRSRIAAILRHWLAAGLDGWRAAQAASAGRSRGDGAHEQLAQLIRDSVGEALVVGEYWHDFERELDGRGWHGITNYAGFLRPMWWWLRDPAGNPQMRDVFSTAPAPAYGGREAVDVMREHYAAVPWESVLHSWLPVESHDTPRLRTVVGPERQLVAIGMQMTYPGVPVVYAGGELGLEGASDDDSRRTMPWVHEQRWDHALLAAYTKLIALRRSSEALSRGGLRFVHVSDDAIAYARETKSERLLCLAARASHEPIAVPFRALETLYGDDAHAGLLPSGGPSFHVWRIDN